MKFLVPQGAQKFGKGQSRDFETRLLGTAAGRLGGSAVRQDGCSTRAGWAAPGVAGSRDFGAKFKHF